MPGSATPWPLYVSRTAGSTPLRRSCSKASVELGDGAPQLGPASAAARCSLSAGSAAPVSASKLLSTIARAPKSAPAARTPRRRRRHSAARAAADRRARRASRCSRSPARTAESAGSRARRPAASERRVAKQALAVQTPHVSPPQSPCDVRHQRRAYRVAVRHRRAICARAERLRRPGMRARGSGRRRCDPDSLTARSNTCVPSSGSAPARGC